LWTIQRVLRQAARIMPAGVPVVLLADRGFADKVDEVPQGKFGLAFIRIKRSFQFQLEGQWRKVSR